ncbi:MAG: GNAT family N-acetyltransferase [Oscillospiraceae bacterium]|jgi:GNAT superfamily N-acetyltransferase|nr:GNAT family N-acetyltransferase [Oscillospiraceae bacterium]
MDYIAAAVEMADTIYNILHTTIKTVYPQYYPQEVVDFFCNHHSKEHILDGIASGNMGVLKVADAIVGAGCFYENHITGLYVLPACQNRGYGSYIMDCLEAEIMKKYDTAVLDASLPAVQIYEHRGYKTTGHGIIELENNVKLVYEIMEKSLKVG